MNHAYYFEKVIGRTLTPRERDVISPLEYVRQHTDQTRIGIIDPPGCGAKVTYQASDTSNADS